MGPLNKDYAAFIDECLKSGFTAHQLERVFRPIQRLERRKRALKWFSTLVTCLFCMALLFAASRLQIIEKPLTAISRIAQIKILPYWDWKYLHDQNCMVNNPFYGEYILTEEDCLSCETLQTVDIKENLHYDTLIDDYLSRDAPVIVSDAMQTWPSESGQPFGVQNITDLFLNDEKLASTMPCVVTTNLRFSSEDFNHLLEIISNPNSKKWFVHWNNCHGASVKAVRRFHSKPYFLSNSVSPAHFSWILMSSEYSSNIYKKINLDPGLIMLAQIKGETSIKLTPLKPCHELCTNLKGNLLPGEILVFTNYLWAFEYLPGSKQENLAILLETSWDDASTK